MRHPEEMELLPGVAEAIRIINNSGYLAIVVTNQPVIARGEVTRIHDRMESLLKEQEAYVDRIYYCPHHPDRGYKGEIPALKMECRCRKPKPSMLIKASLEYNISLNDSWMIGDSERDISAGKAAGCLTALIGNGEYGQDITVRSLIEFVKRIHLNR